MPSLFAAPPKPPAQPAMQAPRNTTLDAQALAMRRRQLGYAGVFNSSGSMNSAPGGTHTVTGG